MTQQSEPETPLAEAVEAARKELNLPETATRAEIDRRFRELTRRWHPDVCEDDPETCRKRMQRLGKARKVLDLLIQRYRYSLRPEDIRRDQEPPAVSHQRRFYESNFDPDRYPEAALTAEGIRRAADRLGLGDTATRHELRSAYRRMAAKHHPDRREPEAREVASERFARIQAAYELLTRFMDEYRYSFRPADVRRDQEGPLEDYRRRFGDPFWAGD
ncbi:MAG: J domain-containing protein [Candidatus Brocadiia bacterium]